MSSNPYKDFYEAASRGDEWSGVDAANARKRIKELEEEASWNGCSVESLIRAKEEADSWQGGA